MSPPKTEPTKSTLNTGTAVLACIIFFLAPSLYVGIEFYVAQAYRPAYSYKHHFTSQLAIPDDQTQDAGSSSFSSPRAHLMNYMFISNGLLFLLGQRLLLACFTTTPRLATTRIFLAVAYTIGIILVAAFPSSKAPQTEEAGLSPTLHFLGAFLAILSGNINSLLTGLVAPKWGLHKIASLVCGCVGLLSVGVFYAGGGGAVETPGLWQRLSIYSTQLWMFFTADLLMGEIARVARELEEVEGEERTMLKRE